MIRYAKALDQIEAEVETEVPGWIGRAETRTSILRNYAAACKTCNSPFKSDYFPVVSPRISGMPHPEDYRAEEALLLYPLGESDADPESLITFVGAKSRPRSPGAGEPGHDPITWRRGRVIIDFLGLNRDGLVYNRAWWLLNAVWPNFRLGEAGDAPAMRSLEWARSEHAPFTSCSRRFLELCGEDRDEATAQVPVLESIVARMES